MRVCRRYLFGGKMKKFKVLKILAILTTAGLVLGGSVQHAAGLVTIRFHLSGDVNVKDLWEKSLIPGFNKIYPEYPVVLTFDRNGLNDSQTLAKIIAAKVTKRDPGIDLIDGGIVTTLGAAGMLYIANKGLLPNIKDVPKALIKGGRGGIPYRASTVLLAYNSKNVSTPPRTIAALLVWIKANPGKFTYNAPSGGGSGGSFVQTVLDYYLTTKETNTLVERADKTIQVKWAKGFDVLRELNKFTYGQNGTYPINNQGTLDLLSKGLIDVAPVWSDQIASAVKAGTMPKDIKFINITGPSFTGGPAYLGIPSMSTNRNGARLLMNWLLTPAAQNLIVSGGMNGLPVIPVSLLDPVAAADISGIDITTLRPPWLSANRFDMNAAWAAGVPGK